MAALRFVSFYFRLEISRFCLIQVAFRKVIRFVLRGRGTIESLRLKIYHFEEFVLLIVVLSLFDASVLDFYLSVFTVGA